MKRKLFGAAALAAVAVTAVLIGTASAAKPPPAPGNASCPTSTSNLSDALNVGASYDAGTGIYSVERFGPAAPTSLVKYCVYTDRIPSTLAAIAVGADGSAWTASKKAKTFSFSRPGGTPTNLALTGVEQEVGSANFNPQPTRNDIVLHINDGAQCFDIYGVVTPTCFVLPGEEPGPVCDDGIGNTNAAYNAIPTDVQDCSPPSLGFEAWQVAEFGDRVTLDTTGGTELVSMTVDFQSYGCETSGHWNTANCVSPPSPGTFTVPGGITANIYDASNLTLIASSTINPNIPYRPTAVLDTACPNNPPADAANSRFLNGAGQCVYSKSVPLTFTFPAGTTFTDGQEVVWTVEFNTTHYGYSPIGEQENCFTTDPGCGYDSLNVGAKSYPNAPYAGGDVNDDEAFISWGANSNTLGPDSGWAPNRPLGQIVTGP